MTLGSNLCFCTYIVIYINLRVDVDIYLIQQPILYYQFRLLHFAFSSIFIGCHFVFKTLYF